MAERDPGAAGGPCPVRRGDPLPDDTLVHRLGPCTPENCRPRNKETSVNHVNQTGKKESGFSLLATYEGSTSRAEAAKRAADEHHSKYPKRQYTSVGTASVKELRDAGFEVVHDPTFTTANHATVYRPDGEWTDENAKILASILKCTNIA